MSLVISIDNLRDHNLIGEVLRNYCFLPSESGDYGACSTFRLRPEFRPLDPASEPGRRILAAMGDPEILADLDPQIHTDGRIHLGWVWDGDGTLVFLVDRIGLVNTDCKKDKNWELMRPDGLIEPEPGGHARSGHATLDALSHPELGPFNAALLAVEQLYRLKKFSMLRDEMRTVRDAVVLAASRATPDRAALKEAIRPVLRIVTDLAARYIRAGDRPRFLAAAEYLEQALRECDPQGGPKDDLEGGSEAA